MWKRLAPSRTKKLSTSWVMILRLTGRGKVAHCGLVNSFLDTFTAFLYSKKYKQSHKIHSLKYGVISIFETISLLHNALKVLSKKPH